MSDNQNTDNTQQTSTTDWEKRFNDSQAFIETLKAERRADDERIKALEDRLNSDEFQTQVTTKTEEPNSQQTTQNVEKSIEEQVTEALNKQLAKKQQNDNLSAFDQWMLQQSNNDEAAAATLLAEKAIALSTTPEKLQELAKDNPALVKQLFNKGNPAGGNPKPTGGNLQTTTETTENFTTELEEMNKQFKAAGGFIKDRAWHDRYREVWMKVKK